MTLKQDLVRVLTDAGPLRLRDLSVLVGGGATRSFPLIKSNVIDLLQSGHLLLDQNRFLHLNPDSVHSDQD